LRFSFLRKLFLGGSFAGGLGKGLVEIKRWLRRKYFAISKYFLAKFLLVGIEKVGKKIRDDFLYFSWRGLFKLLWKN